MQEVREADRGLSPEETNSSAGRVAIQKASLEAEDNFQGFQRLSNPLCDGKQSWPCLPWLFLMWTDEPVGKVPGSFLVCASVSVFWDGSDRLGALVFSGKPGDLGGAECISQSLQLQ